MGNFACVETECTRGDVAIISPDLMPAEHEDMMVQLQRRYLSFDFDLNAS